MSCVLCWRIFYLTFQLLLAISLLGGGSCRTSLQLHLQTSAVPPGHWPQAGTSARSPPSSSLLRPPIQGWRALLTSPLSLPVGAATGPIGQFGSASCLVHLSWGHRCTVSNFMSVKCPLVRFYPALLTKAFLFWSYHNSPHSLIGHKSWCVQPLYLCLSYQEKYVSGVE